MTRLTALSYSPWSEKARWALDHHRIPYEYEEHVPVVGELKLRIRLRSPTGLVTVPVLHHGDEWLTDSFDIARRAERIGGGATLFPRGHDGDIEAWNRRSEEALAAGRAITVLRSADDPAVALEALPPAVPSALRPLLAPVARRGLAAFIKKYRMREGARSHAGNLAEVLAVLDASLAGKAGYLLGGALSYADIAMAVVLQFVAPVDEQYMAAGPGGAAGWANPELAARHPRLIAWRDALYEKHRRPAAAP